MKGVDFGYGKIAGKDIKSKGYDFVCRYLSHSPGKNLTPSEITDFHNNQLLIVVVWETTEVRPLDGYRAGFEDGCHARDLAVQLGVPGDRPIYFAADYDFQDSHMPTIESYFKGAGNAISKDRIGVYGGFKVVSEMFKRGVVQWGWQTYAWSHGIWEPKAQLRQVNIYGPNISGVSCDTNESVMSDFGGF